MQVIITEQQWKEYQALLNSKEKVSIFVKNYISDTKRTYYCYRSIHADLLTDKETAEKFRELQKAYAKNESELKMTIDRLSKENEELRKKKWIW